MFSQHFIFSEERSDRIKRHLVFWFFWWLWFTFIHALLPMTSPGYSYFKNIPYSLVESPLLLIPQIFLVYPLLYFVLPQYIFTNKYVKAIFWCAVFLAISGIVNQLMIMYVNRPVLEFILPERFLINTQRTPQASFVMGVLSSFKGGLLGAAFAVGLKLLKHWYLKEKKNLELLKEKTEAQLQLLTAQVHPHFLFNTLNNIYSQTQTESPKGSKMIMQLSDILRYVLSEGNKQTVPLGKELVMLQDYINLEKVRYGNELDIHVSVPGETGNLQIAPLLLLPFVENCFKHGASKFLSHPWINLKMEIRGTMMIMKLMNGKDTNNNEVPPRSGIGVNNVKKRLELLYKDKYELNITDDPDVFVVDLQLELTENKTELKTEEESTIVPAYA
jgi:sensor histidine kinase YesM